MPSFTACRISRSCAARRIRRSWSSAPKSQGYAALALTDECSLAGAVRAHLAAKDAGLPLVLGSEFTLADGMKLVLLATDRESYGDLSQLITRGRRNAVKGTYRLTRDDVAELARVVHRAVASHARSARGGRRRRCGATPVSYATSSPIADGSASSCSRRPATPRGSRDAARCRTRADCRSSQRATRTCTCARAAHCRTR